MDFEKRKPIIMAALGIYAFTMAFNYIVENYYEKDAFFISSSNQVRVR